MISIAPAAISPKVAQRGTVFSVPDGVLDLGAVPVPVLDLRSCLAGGDLKAGDDEQVAVHGVASGPGAAGGSPRADRSGDCCKEPFHGVGGASADRPPTRRLDQLVQKWAKCLGECRGLAEVGHVCARQFGEGGVQLRSEMCGYFVSPVARRRCVAVVAAGCDEAW
jgi:hypothetical protein